MRVDHLMVKLSIPEQTLEHHLPALVERAHSGQFGMFDMFELRAVAGGKNASFKAELSGFLDARFRLRYSPNLSG